MKKILLIALESLILLGLVHAQNGPAEKWNYYMGGSENEHAKFVLECSDGGFLLIGETRSNDGQVSGNHGSYDAWIVKRKSDGTSDWKYCYGTKGLEYAFQAVEVNDGYVIAGEKEYQAWVFKISKSGSFLWEQSYPSSNGDISSFHAIIKKNDGSFLAGGYTNRYNARIMNLSASGSLLSSALLSMGRSIEEIRLPSDGSILVLGNQDQNEPGCFGGELPARGDVWIAKLTQSYNTIWNKYYGGTTYDVFVDAEINANNEIYFIGRTYCKGQITGPNNIGANWPDARFTWLAKANSSGTLLNAKIVSSNPFYQDLGFDYNCVTVDCKGAPVIGGISGSLLGSYPSIEKWKADLSDIEFWNAQTTGSTEITRNLFDIRFTKDGGYVACGVYNDFIDGKENYFILRTEKDPDCAGSANKCTDITPLYCGLSYSGTTSGRVSRFGIADLSSCHSSSNDFSAGDQLFEIYKPNSTGDLVITLFSDNVDHDIFVLSSCNPVQCLYKSTNSIGSSGINNEIIRINNAPAGYYYILVDGPKSSSTGPFTLTANCGLLDCNNAKPIGCKQTLVNESNQTGYNNVSLYCNPSQISDPGTGCTGKERVYTFTLNSTQNVSIQLSNIRNSNNDFELFLFKDCNEDQCLGTSTNPKGQNETITKTLSAGTYFIVVDGWREASGNYDLYVDWNCCNNPVEVYNCGYITYKYSGNGSNLQFTFTSSKAIAPGKKWKVGANEISNASSTSFTYTFPSAGEYVICFPYTNTNGCLEYCCYRVWIDNPFNCFDWDYSYNPTTNNFSFTLNQSGASNIVWKDDTGGGTIGGGPVSNPVPAPPSGGCIEKTITVTYFLNGRWYICCRKIWLCNPFECFEFDYRYDLNANGMVFTLNTNGASQVTWKDDTGGGDIGGGPISNPVPVPPNPGDCREKIISVKYFYNGRWYICCRKVWICNPFECRDFGFRYDQNSRGYIFQLNQGSATQITWKDDTGGGSIGGGPISNPVPVPPNSGGCIETVITARYFFNGRWYICCKRFWLCDPIVCSGEIIAKVNTNGQVNLSVSPSYSEVQWINQKTGAYLGSGNNLQTNFPYGSDQEICVQYIENGQTKMCCKSLKIVGTKDEVQENLHVKVFPNPGKSSITIALECENENEITVSLLNLQGTELIRKLSPGCLNQHVHFNTDGFPAGIYYIRVLGNHFQSIHKIEIID